MGDTYERVIACDMGTVKLLLFINTSYVISSLFRMDRSPRRGSIGLGDVVDYVTIQMAHDDIKARCCRHVKRERLVSAGFHHLSRSSVCCSSLSLPLVRTGRSVMRRSKRCCGGV